MPNQPAGTECRTPELIAQLVSTYPEETAVVAAHRPVLQAAVRGAPAAELEHLLLDERLRESDLDRAYWLPLRAELEAWRHAKARGA